MENYIMIQNKINEIISKIKELEKEDDRLIRYTNKRLSFYNRAYEMYLQMLRLTETVDKMVKDSQTIDEEIEQQDILKKEGNTFITLEAEGETLVNVCKQEEPVTITKSYTVNNSGNHIALQGEYDGKCRPVITGNTMVNLHTNNLIYFGKSSGDTNIYNITTMNEPRYIKVTCDNTGTGATFRYIAFGDIFPNISMFKANTKYTLVFTKLKGIKQITIQRGDSQNRITDIVSATEGQLSYVLTTTDEIVAGGQVLCLLVPAGVLDVEVEGGMIFEGDLTQTPGLIPTGYVDGLKSSFEDRKSRGIFDFNGLLVQGKGLNPTTGEIYNDNSCVCCTEYIQVKPNTTYKIYDWCNFPGNAVENTRYCFYDENKIYLGVGNTSSVTTPGECAYIRIAFNINSQYNMEKAQVQLEEGSIATEYIPYGKYKVEYRVTGENKEFTKTFYLNSPLLEGDTIEDVNGKATHIKRYGKVVLNGGENWRLDNYEFGLPTENTVNNGLVFSDIFPSKNTQYSSNPQNTFAIKTGSPAYGILIRHDTSSSIAEFKQWLQANPTTVVYQLASPIYETISEESILCDSYVNGHLDFDSVVPIEKVRFRYGDYLVLKYLKPNTSYSIQFESDNIGECIIYLASWSIPKFTVKNGINKQIITLGSNVPYNFIEFNGIGFNASNIVVTEAGADFKYFKGLESSCENNKLDIKVTGKNLSKGLIVPGSDVLYTDVILHKGYTYSIWSNMDKVDTNIGVIKVNQDFTAGGFTSEGLVIQNWGEIKNTFISTFDGLCRLWLWKQGIHTNDLSVSKFQLEQGTQATEYEPYREATQTINLNSPLLKGDRIEVIDGKMYHYHKMDKIVFDGSENWLNSASNTNTNRYHLHIDNNHTKNYTNVKCNNFEAAGHAGTDIECIFIDTSYAYIRISKSKLSTLNVEGFKQWLQANPTTVVYELAEPWYEEIQMPLYIKGVGKHIEIDTGNINLSNINIKY